MNIGTHRGLKRVLEALVLQLQAAQCECWELNSGPLVEWQVLLTAESLLQPLAFDLQ